MPLVESNLYYFDYFIIVPHIRIPESYFFVDINKMTLTFMWKGKRLSIENTILKKNKVRGLMLSNFHTYYEVIVGGW